MLDKPRDLLHVRPGLLVLQHRVEVGLRAPLGVVDNARAVVAAVDVGRDEAGQVPHRLLGSLNEQVHNLLLSLRRDLEDVDKRKQAGVVLDRCHGATLDLISKSGTTSKIPSRLQRLSLLHLAPQTPAFRPYV